MKGALIELVDPGARDGDAVALLPSVVRVNGVDVGTIAENGLELDPGSFDRPTIVTLKLLPGSFVIRGRRASDELRPDVDEELERDLGGFRRGGGDG